VAKSNGYQTAIFSENPTFSAQTGFGHHIDSAHDDIHRKLCLSDFSPFGYVDNVTLREGLSLAREILSRSNRGRNAVNAAYATYLEFLDSDGGYPHHGERVMSQLSSYLSERRGAILTVTNLLDPHDPYHDSPPVMGDRRDASELAALRAGDDFRDILVSESPPPDAVTGVFGGWDGLLNMQRQVYQEYAAEADRLLREWWESMSDQFSDALVVVLGDHGQLFGAEGMVGHLTSLHPHGINVPLAVDPPEEWDRTETVVETPVSAAGVGSAIADVVTGEVDSTGGFVESVAEHSQEVHGKVVACADGPTWSIPTLYDQEQYDDSVVDRLAVRKVACIGDEYVDIYQSRWDSAEVEASSYIYTADERSLVPEREIPVLREDVSEWLTRTYDPAEEQRDVVDERLKALGYA
jgi:hypothetical protein